MFAILAMTSLMKTLLLSKPDCWIEPLSAANKQQQQQQQQYISNNRRTGSRNNSVRSSAVHACSAVRSSNSSAHSTQIIR
jgi:hypothetical protein